VLQTYASSSFACVPPVFALASSTDFGTTEFTASCNYDWQKEHIGKIKRPPLQRLKRHKSYAHNMTGAQLYGV